MSLLLRIAYDGTGFHGFARQRGLRTVQGELESALTELYGRAVRVRGASRTDAGVHARGQLVAFEDPIAIPAAGVVRALAGRLPRDLAALAAWRADLPEGEEVDPRRHNLGKHYRYRLRVAPLRDPLTDRYEWHLGRELDVEAMMRAARHLVGERDFAAFRASDCQARTTIRRMTEVHVRPALAEALDPPSQSPDGDAARRAERPAALNIEVHGEAFLKNMVRIMVGTLVEVGIGRRGPESLPELFERPERRRAGRTAPAAGLTLIDVRWPSAWPASPRAAP